MDNKEIEKITNRVLLQRNSNLKQILNINHRLQEVAVVDGVAFINDSKSTTIESTMYALRCMEQPTILILDSHDLIQDYSVLNNFVHNQVKKIIVLGSNREAVSINFKDLPVHEFNTIEAFFENLDLVQSGDVVLYSPACPTDDRYESFRERGEAFTGLVQEL